jgi:pimeloyl-ACP methyl ester carboxylesterase
MMRPLRFAAVLVLILIGAGFLGRDWLGIPDIPVDVLKSRYGEGARTLEVLGAPVRVKESGAGEPLLLLHGFASSADTWDGWRVRLGARYRVIAIDVPPFAITGPLPGKTMNAETLQTFMDALVHQLGLTRFDLAGNSLGGYVAWNYARRHPEKVDKLVLIDSAGYLHEPPFAVRMMQAPLLRDLSAHFTPLPIVAVSVRDVYGHPERVTQAAVQRYQDLLRREGSRPAVTELMSSLKFDGSGVNEVHVPTLILWGGKDHWIPPAHAALFHRDIRGSRLIVYSDLGHVPMEEDPVRTADDVARFLGSGRPD